MTLVAQMLVLTTFSLAWTAASPDASQAGGHEYKIKFRKPAEIPLLGVKRIAVAKFVGPDDWIGEVVAKATAARLAETQAYEIVHYDSTARVVEKQGLGARGLDERNATLVGRALGADAVVIGVVDKGYRLQAYSTTQSVSKYHADGSGQYYEDCPTEIQSGKLKVTFTVIAVATGRILAKRSFSDKAEYKKVTDLNVGDPSYDPNGKNSLLAGILSLADNPFDKELPGLGEVAHDLVDHVVIGCVNTIAPHEETEVTEWDARAGDRGKPAEKLLAGGKFAEAREAFQGAIPEFEADPKFRDDKSSMAAVYYDLALLIESVGDYDAAIEWYQRAVQTDPNHVGKRLKGSISRVTKRTQEANALRTQTVH